MRTQGAIGFCIFVLFAGLDGFSDTPTPTPPPYATEQEWIVASICRISFELLAYDKDKKGEIVTPAQVAIKKLPGSGLSYDVTVHGTRVMAEATIPITDSIWSAATYIPFCQAAATALKLEKPVEAKAEGNPLQALLDFSEATIKSENERISQWLTREPGNAAAHEQAALVLGTLAMKENSGRFWDPREACNHAAAHLVVAQFLRAGAPLSVEGRLAACLVGLIADTKTETGKELDQLGSEKNTPTELAAWLNAGRMRNTRDWRIVKTPETASPLEQVEYVRALGEAVDPDPAIAWLQAHSIPNRIDWGRIILEEGFSVDAGHKFAMPSIGNELRVMQATFPESFQGEHLVDDLNRSPEDVLGAEGAEAGALVVINRGMWAQFFQRHLLAAIAETGDFFANKWGVPENTQALDHAVGKSFTTLTLYSNLQIVNHLLRKTPLDIPAAQALFTTHPEWSLYALVYGGTGDPGMASLQQAASAWFNPPLLPGTAYAAFDRWSGRVEATDIHQAYAIAPLQYRIAELELMTRSQGAYTFAQAQEVLGPLLDYHIPAIEEAGRAQGLTFDQKMELAEKSATINPEGYFSIGTLYLQNHQEDKAAEAFQKWVDKASDRVEVSNSVEWLVNYYYDHGQQDKALSIAQDAAEVYSSGGLRTMMNLQERMGHLDEAENYGQKILDRYDETSALGVFYKRHADQGDSRFKAKYDDLILKVFPLGLKNVTVASFSGAPSLGMRFAETNDALRHNGLSSDQVVVAIDGDEIQNKAQYTFVRGLSDSPLMHLIVWDGQAYRAIDANQPGRLFGVQMQDYQR